LQRFEDRQAFGSGSSFETNSPQETFDLERRWLARLRIVITPCKTEGVDYFVNSSTMIFEASAMKRYPALSGDQSTFGMESQVMAIATGAAFA
jgi:hypothetical protein